MTIFEAAIVPSIPLGAIIGGVLCKSYGIMATIGGVFVGGIAGGFAGWSYGIFIIFLMSVSMTIWDGVRHQSASSELKEKRIKWLSKNCVLQIMVAIIGAGFLGFKISWLFGLLFVLVLAFVIVFIAVIGLYFHLKSSKTP